MTMYELEQKFYIIPNTYAKLLKKLLHNLLSVRIDQQLEGVNFPLLSWTQFMF